MNRTKIKNYAPQARRDFIQAVMDRAAFYGLTEKKIEPIAEQGDVVIIGGRSFPKAVAAKRKKLEERIERDGFEQTMEALAYTWFNRLVAIRYMELHGYLEHGYRVLSHPDPTKDSPEILEQAEHVDLPGLKKETAIELKLAGDKESELYRMLLTAQCNALNSAMPFLFERINDETELVLPENLLHSDSILRKLVSGIDEEDWQEVEIIGWLYQFYISEKKEQVIGKVVRTEDIPAATQLFTPNWIVKYMVQNSLGQQWMATYPHSPLKSQMEFYIEPAEQTPQVQEQLKATTPESLNPEELTLLDPACGSGHILVEAYDLFKAIYLERGYNKREIPRMILEKNVFGLEVDDRAAQLAALALTMKARADDRRIFEVGVEPHVVSIQESKGLDPTEITEALNQPILKETFPPSGELFEGIAEEKSPLFSKKSLGERGEIVKGDVAQLIELFEHGKTFGSLIQIPEHLAVKVPVIASRAEDVLVHGELFEAAVAKAMGPLLRQALVLTGRYDAVVTNPPYMGNRYVNALVKEFLAVHYDGYHKDLYSAFVIRNRSLASPRGAVGVMAPFTWMFISTQEQLRHTLIHESTITSLVQLEYSGFAEATVPVCTFTFSASHHEDYLASFVRLTDFRGSEQQGPRTLEAIHDKSCGWMYHTRPDDFPKVPGMPIAYWLSDQARSVFQEGELLSTIAEPRQGLATANNDRFIRLWHEVDFARIRFNSTSRQDAQQSGGKWFPYNKGGDFRKWYGNNEYVVNWENDGHEIRNYFDERGKLRSRPQNVEFFFRPSVTWSFISSAYFGVRQCEGGAVFDVAGSSAFPNEQDLNLVTAFLCSSVAFTFMKALNPTLNFQVGNVASLPIAWRRISTDKTAIERIAKSCVQISRLDWNQQETSWGFIRNPLVSDRPNEDESYPTIRRSLERWTELSHGRISEMQLLETENNRIFMEAYGLEGELSPEVPENQITLYRPDQTEDLKRLLSYAIGCMMGRFSLYEPGLIYAHSGNEGFDHSHYRNFPADADGIVPLIGADWFADDAANRFVEFIGTAWPKEHLEENLKFVADGLGLTKNEQPREAIRRYLATGFYKHHLSMYKRRPIYWLFSSGKQRAFQCLVYLHRYNEGTLSRMRTEYVIPLQGKLAARIEQLAADITNATSTSHRKKLEKERDTLLKQQNELQTFDEKLRHYADQRISLDLDDGVKVNYAKFGDLLAEVKAVTGGKAE